MKWLMFMFLGLSTAQAAEVTLYAINSPFTLNWETPRSLLLSTMRSSVNPTRQGRSNHTIGHAYLGFKCDGQEEILSGMTSGKGFSSRNNLFNEKHGLSVILQDNPGHFQKHAEVKSDVEFFSRISNRMSAMKIEVTNEQCLKARAWYDEFEARPEHIYGGIGRRPLTGEGSGCSAYVMSYFEAADINFEFFNKLFEQTLFIPEELLGGSFGNREVPLKNIMGSKHKLGVKADKTYEVNVYDPNTMYFWIINKWQEAKKGKELSELSQYEVKTELNHQTKTLILKLK